MELSRVWASLAGARCAASCWFREQPAGQIRTLAADASSRTSVALARIVLARRYGVEPVVVACPPDLAGMLEEADSALIIGDPALRIDPETTPFHVYDLGREWTEMTGLPMVFAVWAGPREFVTPQVAAVFQASCTYGLRSLERIVGEEAAARGFATDLVRRYLGSHIVFELGHGGTARNGFVPATTRGNSIADGQRPV